MEENKLNINSKLLTGTIIYAIGNFGTKILSFMIVPMYTYYIASRDMGMYDLVNTTLNMLFPLLTLQIADAAYRWLIRGGGNEYKRCAFHVIIINSTLFVLIISIVNCLIKIPYYRYIPWTMITSAFLDVMQKMLRGINKQKLFALSGVLYTFIFLILNVIQICLLKRGVESLFTSTIFANMIVILVLLIKEPELRINILGDINIKLIKKMLGFSIPLVPNQLNWWIMSSSDRYIITMVMGAAANGIYSIAYKFPSLLQIILSLFNSSWQDISISESDNIKNDYSYLFELLYKVSFSLLFWLIPLTKIYINLFMNADYKNAAFYVAFLYLGTVFQGFSSFYGVGYLRDKNTKQASMTSIYGAMINLAVNVILIKFIGLHAAAFSTFMGFLAMWLIRQKQNKNILHIHIQWKKLLCYFFVSVAYAVICCITNTYIDIILTLFGIITFLICNRDLVLKFYSLLNIHL